MKRERRASPAQGSSSYEGYNDTSSAYDSTRVPVGVPLLLEQFATSALPLAEQRLLDLGCGTGSYLHALREQAGELIGLDGSTGMLAQARQKCGRTSNTRLVRGSILHLPFASASFDGTMINQVLHHLESAEQHQRCFDELFRALRPGGVLCINSCSQEQLQVDGPYWYYHVFPEAARHMAARYASVESLSEMLRAAGFASISTHAQPDEAFFASEQYFDVQGHFQKAWRDGDSAFAAYKGQSALLESRLQALRSAISDQSIHQIVAESERIRERIGQYVMIVARK